MEADYVTFSVSDHVTSNSSIRHVFESIDIGPIGYSLA